MAHFLIGIEPFFIIVCGKAAVGRLYRCDGNDSGGCQKISDFYQILSRIIQYHYYWIPELSVAKQQPLQAGLEADIHHNGSTGATAVYM